MEAKAENPGFVGIGDDEVAAYRTDGALCLRGAFDAGWVARLRNGVERNMCEPGPWAAEHRQGVGAGRFFEDYCNWQRIAEYRDFVLESPAAAIAARFMGASAVQIFHEHVLIKEPGTAKRTPWHHDMPYYCVEGDQVISLWLALDPVPQAVCPEFVAGSHRWGKLYYPRTFEEGRDYDYGSEGFDPVPDIDAARNEHRLLSWSLEPGDAILFHFLTLHGAPGNTARSRRRGFATRWLGDDVRFAARPGVTSPPYPGIGLEPGDRMREDWFPVVWTRDRGRSGRLTSG
ncbi:MAG: phytanoyl-CoA dioxygenase family protein [Kiloniellales bacterium]|nr:phytanoyl-CoA dioxygenase family protein [Kiloniellales bacterium]